MRVSRCPGWPRRIMHDCTEISFSESPPGPGVIMDVSEPDSEGVLWICLLGGHLAWLYALEAKVGMEKSEPDSEGTPNMLCISHRRFWRPAYLIVSFTLQCGEQGTQSSHHQTNNLPNNNLGIIYTQTFFVVLGNSRFEWAMALRCYRGLANSIGCRQEAHSLTLDSIGKTFPVLKLQVIALNRILELTQRRPRPMETFSLITPHIFL